MSKAFTNEESQLDEDDEKEPQDAGLPGGVKNYITPPGADKLRSELRQLLDHDRPEIVKVVSWAASNGDRSENADYIYGKRRLREIDRRIRFLSKRLDAAEIVDPSEQKSEKVLFGATVTVLDEEGNEKTYSIVGVDETDGKKGHVSWISPVAKALLRHKVGDTVTVRMPKGDEDWEILLIEYKPLH